MQASAVRQAGGGGRVGLVKGRSMRRVALAASWCASQQTQHAAGAPASLGFTQPAAPPLAARRHRVPDVEFLLNFHDQPVLLRGAGRPAPMLSWSTTPYHWDIMVPSQAAFGAGVPPTPEGVEAGFDGAAWEKREARAVWRGVTTGGRPD